MPDWLNFGNWAAITLGFLAGWWTRRSTETKRRARTGHPDEFLQARLRRGKDVPGENHFGEG